MTKTILLSGLFAFLFFSATAQSGFVIRGKLADTSENKALAKAVVALLRPDSVLLSYTRTNATGDFTLKAPAKGNYLLMMSYPSYADYADILTIDKDTDLGTVAMLTKAVLLQNVIVRGSSVRMRGDTLAFLADSFKVREGANVEDLLKRLPGLTVNNKGEITAQGQKVERVLVDGDEFFGDDPTLATRNLQAAAIKEVQVFDRKSDQATFTGVDDGQTQKTINLKLKDEYKRGYFGKLKLGGGLPERFENQGMINAFNDKRKLSVFGVGANTNNVSLGWSEENQFGGGMGVRTEVNDDGGVSMWASGDEFGGIGGYYGEGLPQSFTLGTSFSNKWNANKSKVLGAYRWQQLTTEANTSQTTQNILPDTQFFNNQKGRNVSDRMRHRMQVNSELALDSMQSITINASGTYGRAQTNSVFDTEALTGDSIPVNRSNRTSTSDGTNANVDASMLYKLKFKKARRTLSANISGGTNQSESDGFLLNYNEFFTKGQLLKRDTVDQRKENETRGNNFSSRIAYTEPVGKQAIVEMSYGFSMRNSRQKRLSFDKVDGKYDALNQLFSNDFRFKTNTHRVGAGYRYNKEKFNFGFGSDVAFNKWQQEDFFRDTTRFYQFTNLFPRANLGYKLGQYSRIGINYRGNTEAPTAEQLQPLANNNDPLNIMIGNPELRQSFSHSLELNYNFWKMLSNTGMWMYLSMNTVDNDFSTQSFVDSLGRRISQTVNVDGNWSIEMYMGFNSKWKKPDIRYDLFFNPRLFRNVNFVNNEQNVTTSQQWELSASLFKEKDEKYSISLRQVGAYNVSKSSIRTDLITRYWTTTTELDGTIHLPWKLILESDISYNWRQQTEVFSDNNNALIWNASLEKKIHKKKDMRIGIMAADILNQNIGFRRTINSNFVTENTYDVIRRYWMVTFNWTFNKGPQKAEEDNW